ncbi:MFS transporter [Streptomyces sp. b94]|nr:MFS transporter [Streptomyces sp. b94]
MAAFSQLTGINAVVYYAPTMLPDAGFGDSIALLTGIGMQSVVWLIAPEILPLSVRGPATSLATLTVWEFDLLIAATALSTINALGRSGTFSCTPR